MLGLVLIGLAYFPLAAQSSAPGWAMAAMRERPWLLGLLGLAVGTGQAPTDVPYLTGLAMLAAVHPRPASRDWCRTVRPPPAPDRGDSRFARRVGR